MAKNVYLFRTNILLKLQNIKNENAKEQTIEGKMSIKTMKIRNIEGITIHPNNVER